MSSMKDDKDPETIILLNSEQDAKAFADEELVPRHVELGACEEGIIARNNGISSEDNPYDETDPRWDEWEDGWHLRDKSSADIKKKVLDKFEPHAKLTALNSRGAAGDPRNTINVLVHGDIQQWTAYPPVNKDPETLTVENHHDYASDVSLVFNVETRELVDFRKNRFLSEAKWVD